MCWVPVPEQHRKAEIFFRLFFSFHAKRILQAFWGQWGSRPLLPAAVAKKKIRLGYA